MGRNDAVICDRCHKRIIKKNAHNTFAGYWYCRECWPLVGMFTKIFKR